MQQKAIIFIVLGFLFSFILTVQSVFATVVGATTTAAAFEPNTRAMCRSSNQTVHVVWQDSNTIVYAKLIGNNWVVNSTIVNTTDTKDNPSISCYGNNITIAYRAGTNIVVFMSTDDGESFTSSTFTPSGSYQSSDVQVERRGNNIYLVYRLWDGAKQVIWAVRSTNAGASWGSPIKIIESGSNYPACSPSMVVDGTGGASDKIYVVGTIDQSKIVNFARSTNSGASWDKTSFAISPTGFSCTYSAITFKESNLFVVAINDSSALWFMKSTDGGATWTNETLFTPEAGYMARRPTITINHFGYPTVLFEYNRANSNYDIVGMSFDGNNWTSVYYETNNNLGNMYVNAPYKQSEYKFEYMWVSGTSSPYNINVNAFNHGLFVTAFNENSNPIQPIVFNISITNETSSKIFNNVFTFYRGYDEIPTGNLTLLIWRADSPTRFYYTTITSESNINLNAYLLKATEGTYITTFTYSYSKPQGEKDVLVSALRFINSSWVVAEQKKSDEEGKGFFFLYPFANYKIKAEKEYIVKWIDSYYPNPNYVLRILIEEGTAPSYNFTWIFDTVSHKLEPFNTYLADDWVLFKYTVSSSLGDLEEYGMEIKWNNTVWNTSVNYNPSGGVIELNFSLVNKTGSISVTPWFKRTGYPQYNFTRKYIIWFSEGHLPNVLTSLHAGNWGLSPIITNMIAVLASMLGAGLVSKWHAIGGSIIFLLILAFFVAIGWFDWMIFIMLAIVAIAIILIRSGILFG